MTRRSVGAGRGPCPCGRGAVAGEPDRLGGELAARAAKDITSEQLDGLEAIVKQQEKAIAADDEDGMVEYGHTFHRQINLAADSHRLSLLLRSVVKQLPNRFYLSIDRAAATREEHPLILGALRRRKLPHGPLPRGAAHPRQRRPPDRDARGTRRLEAGRRGRSGFRSGRRGVPPHLQRYSSQARVGLIRPHRRLDQTYGGLDTSGIVERELEERQ
ncbi:FCD domain-containing protein [Streptomyces sp. NRRL F-2799]|uniref:FCD domain-containing protein n=1 Tax=Streptomyces sp. NRRL F-2799 TaxID=1463844 RepID=UPI001F26E67D|nr:FCD domain-containing protein [Streptomyces sp. NRRL F-2799]